MQSSRRQILQAGLTGAAAVAFGSQLTRAAGLTSAGLTPADNVLVVIQLSGGNDGLNTVVPSQSREYRLARPHIAITSGLHPLDQGLALHPAMSGFKRLYDRGQLAVINGCGYPQPNRSHFRSLEIWHTADPSCSNPQGWLGRYIHENASPLTAINIGSHLPQALAIEGRSVPSIQTAEDGRGVCNLAAYESDVAYPAGLGKQLELVARMIDANVGTRVFYLQLAGFDTHANQLSQHETQLAQLSDSVAAFFDDLAVAGHGDRVAVMCFSEFGRRLAQNNSNGTDHGAAGPMFVVGPKVRGGIYGAHPSLTRLDHGDLKYTTDFRRVYGTVLDKWLGADSARVLGNRFEPVAFL